MLLDSLSNSAGLSHGARAPFCLYPACAPSSRITVRACEGRLLPEEQGFGDQEHSQSLQSRGLASQGPILQFPSRAGREMVVSFSEEFRACKVHWRCWTSSWWWGWSGVKLGTSHWVMANIALELESRDHQARSQWWDDLQVKLES